MARKPTYRVYELIHDGLPVFVGACRVDQVPTCKPPESIRWLLGNGCPLDEPAAHRFVKARIEQICRWATGISVEAPAWLRNRLPVPPRQRGNGHGRPVVRVAPDGRTERFASVWQASKAIGRDQVVIFRRLYDGCADFAGCTWHDDSDSTNSDGLSD